MPWQKRDYTIPRYRTIYMKVIGHIIIITFILNNSLPNAFSAQTLFGRKSHAQRYAEKENEKGLIILKENPAAVTIPDKYGLIIDSYKGKGEGLVVHIQDCHVNELAQLNIAGILKTLIKNYDINLLCLEGASKELDTSFYDSFPDGEIKERISRFFVRKALFTGAEYLKIADRSLGISAFGAEDKELYLTHLKAYQETQPDKDKVISYLRGLEAALNRIKQQIYSEPLKELEAKEKRYRDKLITLSEYASYIDRFVRRLKIDVKPYADFRDFISLVRKEKKIDFKKAEQQREELVRELTQRLKERELSRLLKMSLDYRLNRISAMAFYDYLQEFIPAGSYKELLSYIEYLRISSAIKHLGLFDEIDSLNEKIASGLFKSQVEKTAFRFSRSLALLEDLYGLRLTPKILNYIDGHPAEFDIRPMAVFIKNTSAALDIPANFNYRFADINSSRLNSAREFYRIATRRDIAIVDNTLMRLSSSPNKSAVLLTGGFHTSGITALLREKDISYVVICPVVGMEDNQRLYADRMRGIVPDYADILQLVPQMLVPALVTGGIVDNLKIKTAFSIAFAGMLQSRGLSQILEQGLTLPDIGDDRPLRLEEAAGIMKAVIDAERAETGKPVSVEAEKMQEATIAVSEKLPIAAIKMSSAGQADVEAIRREVDKQFSYEYKPQKVIMPDERAARRYHFTRDKAEIIRMLEERNWYYRYYDEHEKKAFIERIWDGLQDGLTEHIKKRVASAVGIKEEDIVSILLYGSWAYTKGTPTDLGIAVIVKGEHIREVIQDCNIEHPERFFTRKGRYVDNFDLSVISEDYLREAADTTAIDFLTSMWGHGILLEGMDYLRSPPADHNILIKARLLTMLALLYCEDKVREDDEAKIDPKEKLRKIERRISEAGKIFKLLFSESHLGIGDEEMGVKPALEAIDGAVEIINKANGALEGGRGVSEAVFTDSLFSLLGRAWEQTQTVFVEERLIAQEVERRLVEIRGLLQQKAPQAIQGLTLSGPDIMEPPASAMKTSSAGSVATAEKPRFSVKRAAQATLLTTIAGVAPLLVVGTPSDTKHGMVMPKDDPSDTRTPEKSSNVAPRPRPAQQVARPRITKKVVTQTMDKPSRTLRGAPAIEPELQPIPQPPTVPQRDRPERMKVTSVVPPAVSQTAPAIQPRQVLKVHPSVVVAEEGLTAEQKRNYRAERERIASIVELVFSDKLSEEQKRCWRLLLLGTVSVESHFLDTGMTDNGNGKYQIVGETGRLIVHNYVKYPVKIRRKGRETIHSTGVHEELITLFAKATNGRVTWGKLMEMDRANLKKLLAEDDIKKATNGRVTWEELIKMSHSQLKELFAKGGEVAKATDGRATWDKFAGMHRDQQRRLCAEDNDYACLISILVYLDEFGRKGIKTLPFDADALAARWKVNYNTKYGSGILEDHKNREGAKTRFRKIHKPVSEALRILHKKTTEEGLYKGFFDRAVLWLLRDEYGITASNIFSKLTAFESTLDNKIRYARLKDDKLVHIVVYRIEGKLNARLVVCEDISQWASRKDKAMAEVLIQDRNELYNVLTEPFLNPEKVKDLERIQREAGIRAERIPTLSLPVQRAIGAATVAPRSSSAGSSAMMTDQLSIILRNRKSQQEISQQA